MRARAPSAEGTQGRASGTIAGGVGPMADVEEGGQGRSAGGQAVGGGGGRVAGPWGDTRLRAQDFLSQGLHLSTLIRAAPSSRR